MTFKQNRALSFLIVTLVYAAAAAGGIALYLHLPLDWWLSLLIADVAATVFTFLFSVLLKNASVYDPYWSVQPLVILFAFAAKSELTPTTVLILAAVTLWGVRLTANWAYTFGNLTHEDWRYRMLHEKTGKFYPLINFVGIHMVPTLIVYGCTLPAAYAMLHPAKINVGFVLCLLVCVLAVTLQTVSDIQMHRYRKNRTALFIRVGIWKHSRHPNYLGEILMWWGVASAVTCLFPHAWYLCAGAFANTLLFLFVSIPMADGRQSRKEGFAEYKRETRMLLPLPKRIK